MKFILPILICIIFCFSQCQSQPEHSTSIISGDTIYTYKKGSPDGIGKWYLGREIAYVMGFSGAAWLERDERQKEEIQNLPLRI